jgi:LacI family repressor for deo operon, udp, cdd, tsx, nupC, and nupG
LENEDPLAPRKALAALEPIDRRLPTMADVAREAAVSTATVSYALSGREELLRRVGPEARGRIAAAVEQLGYVHNKAARHLRLQKAERVCVLLPKLGIPFADKITRDFRAAAQARGCSIIVVTGETTDIWRRVIREVEAGLADALVADADILAEEDLKELFGRTLRLTKPRLVLHPSAAPHNLSVVNYDRLDSLRHAVEHLRDRGHRRIAYVENVWHRRNERSALVRELAARQGSGFELVAVVTGANSRADAAAAVRTLFASAARPDGILVESDFGGVTVIEELQRLGLRVPDDVAVIGAGNAEEGYHAHPRLTTIGPTEMSFQQAAEHLMDLVAARGAEGYRRFVVPWTLIVREST